MLVTTATLGVLSAGFLALSVNVIRTRRSLLVPVGDGADERLLRAIRAQGNFAEYSLFAIALLAACEYWGAPWWWLAPLAAAFAIGRVVHADGLLRVEPDADRGEARFRPRVRGMAATFTVIALLVATMLASLGAALF